MFLYAIWSLPVDSGSSAPEEYQRRMCEALEGLEGTAIVADDILVYGEGNTELDARIDHERKLKALLDRCKKKKFKLINRKLRGSQRDE